MSRAQDVVTNLLAFADVRINGARPWDIQVHDQRFFSRVLASGTLGFGESYMDGWWGCDALDWICERLRLRPGLRLLDIGCGWGGLARHAARQYGCQVVGITISQEQFCYAQRWCRGLDVEIQLRDYREVTERFDRVVSVGMVEHVGYKNYRTYMRAAARSLGEDGLFLCQGICGNFSRVHTDPWIERYIFPN